MFPNPARSKPGRVNRGLERRRTERQVRRVGLADAHRVFSERSRVPLGDRIPTMKVVDIGEATQDPLATHRDVEASRRQVWDVIADGWTYSQWVIGNSRIRAVDPGWPAPGSAIHHSIGVWPLVISDDSVAEECVAETKLVLLAKIGPVGAARITVELTDLPTGCRISMPEVPVKGPMALVPDRLALAAITPRNKECLFRLAALAERRRPGQSV